MEKQCHFTKLELCRIVHSHDAKEVSMFQYTKDSRAESRGEVDTELPSSDMKERQNTASRTLIDVL